VKVTCGDLFTMATNWGKALEKAEQFKMPTSIMDNMQEFYLQEKKRQCLEYYRKEMEIALKENPKGVAQANFELLNEKIMMRSLLLMGSRESAFGCPEKVDFVFFQLQTLWEEARIFRKWNMTMLERRQRVDNEFEII